MKNLLVLSFSLLALVPIGLVVTGNNKTNPRDVIHELNKTSVAGICDEGCCANSASKQVVATQTGGCCGKCGDVPALKSAGDKPGSEDSHVNTMPEDRDIFHFLLANHDKITRTVTELGNGVRTVTESTDAAITTNLQKHVASMNKRIEDGRPLRMWDQLYREVFKHADKIKMEIKNTKNGVAVTETSEEESVVKLIQAHAKVVTGFAERGFEEARLNHEPPGQ